MDESKVHTHFTCLYYAFIYPYMIYGNVIWGGTNLTHLDPLIKLQKKIIGIIHSQPFRAHTNSLFLSSTILKLVDIHQYFLCLFVF